MKNTTTTSATVLAHLDTTISALEALQQVNEQLAAKLLGNEVNPLGSRNMLVQMRQNLQFERANIRKGVLTNHMGHEIGTFADIADILDRQEDMSVYIDS